FIRTTDLVEDVRGVLAQLEAEQPDVLLLQTIRETPIGRRSPGPRQTSVGDVSPEVFDKVFRRTLVGRFGTDGFDELTAIWPALPTATRCAATTVPACASRWTRTWRSLPPTGTAATPATRARSTSARRSSCPACAACGSSTKGCPCPMASSTWSPAPSPTTRSS